MKRLLILFLFLPSSLMAQTGIEPFTDSLLSSLVKVVATTNAERVFVHSDKLIYRAGETIYFRAYCLNSFSGKLDRDSKILFVDLTNENDKVLATVLLNNRLLKTEGYIILADTLSQGDYWLRSYTSEMVQNDTSSIFVKHIYVLNPKKKNNQIQPSLEKDNRINSGLENYQMVFYPEGGRIIPGMHQRVAFELYSSSGSQTPHFGYVTNEEDSIVARFKSNSNGLGTFDFYPENEEHYAIHIESAKDAFPLPGFESNGAKLSISKRSDTSFSLLIGLGDDLFKKNVKTVLVGINQGRLFYGASGTGIYEVQISNSEIPEGKSDFLLYDESKHILSQRAVNFAKGPFLTISTDKDNYGAREKVKLSMSISDEKRRPKIASLSMSVTNNVAVKQPFIDQQPLPDSFRLYTQNRDYANLDLTKTERRKKAVEPEYISGRVLDKKGIPKGNQLVTLFSGADAEEISFGLDTTDAKGKFCFPLPQYSENIKFQLEVSNLKGDRQDLKIDLDSAQLPSFKTPKHLKNSFDNSMFSQMQNSEGTYFDTVSLANQKKMLSAVTVRAKKKQVVNYDDSKRLSTFSSVVSWDKIQQGINGVENALLMTPGISLLNGFVTIKGIGGFTPTAETEPLIVVDGTPLLLGSLGLGIGTGSPVLSYLRTLSPNDIEFIEVLSGPEGSYFGVRGAHGVISINTRSGPRKRLDSQSNALQIFHASGYLTMIPFSSPEYYSDEQIKNPYPDQRSTIYWNGNILTNNEGKATVEFFTADDVSDYTVTVIAVTIDGEMINGKTTIHRK